MSGEGDARGSRVILNMGAPWAAIKRAAIKGLVHSPGGRIIVICFTPWE